MTENRLVTDGELMEMLGVPPTVARPVIRRLDDLKAPGWPRKQELWGGRRWWPDVVAYFNRQGGIANVTKG